MLYLRRFMTFFAVLLATAALLLTVPGGVCVCAKAAADACPCDDAGGAPCGDNESDRGCDHGCALVCCTHPPIAEISAVAFVEREALPERLSPLPSEAIETASQPPLLPPPRA